MVRGASTITQQLAKNLYLSTSRNPLRKLQEVFISRELEQHLSKERIFEIYLNVIEWGDGIYGIDAASKRYFGKSPADLRPEEAAVLAAMIPNPRRYTPRLNGAYLEKRKGEILDHMVQWHYLERSDYEDAASASGYLPVGFTGPLGALVRFLVEDHHQDKSDNNAGGPNENSYSETIHFFHGRYYTDYGVTAGISLTSYVSFVVSTT